MLRDELARRAARLAELMEAQPAKPESDDDEDEDSDDEMPALNSTASGRGGGGAVSAKDQGLGDALRAFYRKHGMDEFQVELRVAQAMQV